MGGRNLKGPKGVGRKESNGTKGSWEERINRNQRELGGRNLKEPKGVGRKEFKGTKGRWEEGI